MHAIDILVQNNFAISRTPFLTEILYLITILFDFSIYFALLTIVISFLVYYVHGLRHMLLFLASMFTGAIVVYAMKLFFNVNRPLEPVMSAFGQSFPSYHATLATIFFVMIIYIFSDNFHGFRKVLFDAFCVLSIFIVAFSRVYLGVHWVSDVAFGIVLGSGICYVLTKVSERFIL